MQVKFVTDFAKNFCELRIIDKNVSVRVIQPANSRKNLGVYNTPVFKLTRILQNGGDVFAMEAGARNVLAALH